jgi:hypothetical protein
MVGIDTKTINIKQKTLQEKLEELSKAYENTSYHTVSSKCTTYVKLDITKPAK